MTLPIGEWRLIANGHTRFFKVESVDSNGRLNATMQNTFKVNGFWDERSKRIIFQRIIEEGKPRREQTYVGYLMDDPDDEETNHYRMAGYFDDFGPAARAERIMHGWFGQIGKTVSK